MSMTRNLLGLALIAVAGTAVSADPAPVDINAEAFTAQVDGLRNAVALNAKTDGTREDAQWAYNILDCDICYWGLNLGWADASCWTDWSNCGNIYILPMGSYVNDSTPLNPWDGPLPYHALGYDDGAGNIWMLDMYADDYQSDAGIWGDTAQLQSMVAFGGDCWVYNAYSGAVEKTFAYNYFWFSADGTEFYGGWRWEILSAVGDNFAYTLVAGEIDAPLDPADTFEIPYEGLIVLDYDNETPEGLDDGGSWSFYAGGDMADPTFPYPTDLYQTGFNDELYWFSMGVDDPQVDEMYDGEAGLSYLDLINTGFLVSIQWGDLAQAHPTKMAIGGGGVNPCPGDLDNDGDTDQSDLGILLAAFQVNGNGDLDGDGDTDQSDLGILLADFGCPG
jgi:hypothetical protein